MKFKVLISGEAEKDIVGICNYVAKNDSPSKAIKLFEKIGKEILDLEDFPSKGHIPPELERINVIEYLEIHYKLYRIFYQIFNKSVFIHCVLEGRRNLSEILQKKILR